MKNLKLLTTVFAFVLALSSCSKDDDETPTPAVPSIVGTWDYNQYGQIDASGNITDLKDWGQECSTKKENMTFATAGGFSWDMPGSDCKSLLLSGTYTLSGENLTTVYSNGNQVNGSDSYIIISVTATELKLKTIPRSKKTSNSVGGAYVTTFKRR
jgi:hypothetical protein